jgi:hypothetical protein
MGREEDGRNNEGFPGGMLKTYAKTGYGNHVSVFLLLVLVIQCVLHICTADIGSSGIGMMFLGVCHVESGSAAVL